MVRSLIEYCCPLWHPSKISDIQELESVQKAFTARISGMRDLHYWDRLVYLSLMSLQRRRERFIILHMWKILHGKTSNDLNVLFVLRPRLGNLAVIPSKRRTSSTANLTLFDNSFAVQGPKLWNAIPYHLNVIQDLEHFKDKLTKFMCLSLISRRSGDILLQIRTLCCAGATSETLLRYGVVRRCDGPVKS